MARTETRVMPAADSRKGDGMCRQHHTCCVLCATTFDTRTHCWKLRNANPQIHTLNSTFLHCDLSCLIFLPLLNILRGAVKFLQWCQWFQSLKLRKITTSALFYLVHRQVLCYQYLKLSTTFSLLMLCFGLHWILMCTNSLTLFFVLFGVFWLLLFVCFFQNSGWTSLTSLIMRPSMGMSAFDRAPVHPHRRDTVVVMYLMRASIL